MSSIIAIIWTAVIVLAAPIAGLLARKPLAARKKPRILIYAGSAANLIVIGAITAVIDIKRGGDVLRAITWHTAAFAAWSIGISILLILISVAFFVLRQKFKRPPSEIVMSLLPETIGERLVFLLLCFLIGFVEEFLFRGFAFFTLAGLTGSVGLPAAIITFSFALQHGIQDAIGVVRAFVLGVLLLIPVLITGSLLPSIVAHTIVDMFSGLYGRAAMASFRSN
jgi:membrane protease YdiL (CAAX protease family)